MKRKNQRSWLKPTHLSAFLLVLFILLIQLPAEAQSLIVLEKNGHEYAFSFDRLDKIYFTNDQLVVDRTNGVLNSYQLSSLQSLHFTESNINTSSKELALDQGQLILFPNPASEWLNIGLDIPSESEYTVEIYTFSGQRYMLQILHGGNHVIDIAHLPHGLYMCRVCFGEQQFSKKFMKN
ncbi:MAG: T9SS type A sorting domain-containing protein [Prolixibacteraceae bacterium]|nr:T9SS type A sorting domain-containing protein [Prolixibacteraceae bacterium]